MHTPRRTRSRDPSPTCTMVVFAHFSRSSARSCANVTASSVSCTDPGLWCAYSRGSGARVGASSASPFFASRAIRARFARTRARARPRASSATRGARATRVERVAAIDRESRRGDARRRVSRRTTLEPRRKRARARPNVARRRTRNNARRDARARRPGGSRVCTSRLY